MCLSLQPGTDGWIAQRHRIEPNNIDKKKINEMIPILIDWCLAQWSSEILHQATDGSRFRDPQQTLSRS